MPRKSLQERIEGIQAQYIKAVLALDDNPNSPSEDYKFYLNALKRALRALRLRERDVIYRVRDAEAKLEGARSCRKREE